MQREVLVGVLAAVLGFVGGRLSAGQADVPGERVDSVAPELEPEVVTTAPSVAEPATSEAGVSAPEAPLELLSRCRVELQQARARALAKSGGEGASRTCSVEACLADPAVLAACSSVPGMAELEAEEAEGLEEQPGSGGASFARRFASSVVGVGPSEAEWLEDYLCTVHQMREDMVMELDAMLEAGAPDDRVQTLIDDARKDRAAMLADLEQELGAERYAALRAVGGLGIMGAALDCRT